MKKVLKIIGVLALLLLVVLLLCPMWLGPVAGMVANSVVPGITGTDFNVQKIRINPYTGALRVEKLRLANPKGYDAEDAVALDLLSVKIAPMSLLKDTITVNDITLENPYVSYLSKDGTNNFDQIIANVTAGQTAKEEEKAEEVKEEVEGKKVIVEHLSISGTRVRYGIITLPIPNIVLNGIGASQGGVTVESVGLEIWEKIKSSFSSVGGAIGGAVGDAAKMLGDGASGLLNSVTGGDAAKGASEAAKSVTEGAKNLLGNAGEGAKAATSSVTEGAKAATSSVTEGTKAASTTVTEGSKAATDAVTDGAKKAADTVTDGAKKATEAIGNLFK